ncbi:YfhE family protein [Sediminibacillus massiliensis]|nr:YfhE family protein [Sediminibacillus massiliensis]
MQKKQNGVRDQKSSLSKTQEVLYQKEFKSADRAYMNTKNRV